LSRIIKNILLTVFILFLITNVIIWLRQEGIEHGYFSRNFSESIDRKTIIADYTCINDSSIKEHLFLERIKLTTEYKYIFLNKIRFSEKYSLNPHLLVPKHLTWLVISDYGDTLAYPAVRFLNKIPSKLLVYIFPGRSSILKFELNHIYQDNLENKPEIPLMDIFTYGPMIDGFRNGYFPRCM